jgi:hypothetical protein
MANDPEKLAVGPGLDSGVAEIRSRRVQPLAELEWLNSRGAMTGKTVDAVVRNPLRKDGRGGLAWILDMRSPLGERSFKDEAGKPLLELGGRLGRRGIEGPRVEIGGAEQDHDQNPKENSC